ncbi:MAG: hypothetical protein VCD31_01660 [Alphaproteobacteria bacterium]
MNASEKRSKLVDCIKKGEFVTAPGVFDMVSARIADRMPFKALYMTGYGVAASHLGVPDAGIASFGDVVSPVSLGGSKPPTLSILIVDTVKQGNNWPRAAVVAVVMVLTLIVVAFTALYFAYGVKRAKT